eukprot:Skav203036  [mRNA]  locus=scaffold583:586762:587307:+ [translate_table: standard]
MSLAFECDCWLLLHLYKVLCTRHRLELGAPPREPASIDPLDFRTVLASLIASCFIFLGLLAASLSELPDFLPSDRLRLPLRVVAWAFLFYIPIMVVSAPLVRNYVLWGLKPGRGLQDAWPDSRERHRCVQMLRSWGLPLLLHVVWGTIYAALICIPVRPAICVGFVWFGSVAKKIESDGAD